MATATHERPEVPATITLVLTEEEALYVYGALNKVDAVPEVEEHFLEVSDSADPVYDALGSALREAGVALHVTSARVAPGRP